MNAGGSSSRSIVSLPQRRAGAARPGRQRHRQRRERLQRQLVLPEGARQGRRAAGDHAAGDAPAGQQHHRGHRRGPRAAAGAARRSCRRRCTCRSRQDRSKTIRDAFNDIQITMLITLVLVVGVIYLFLHNGSATLIPALALPFSILGTFAVMQLLNFSLNNLSMMALILSIGFVVDDAIVMLENIVRHMEKGETPLEAALQGSKEIGFTILTMTTSLAAVFIPILFMSGMLGRLFREFAVTITTAILISGVVSVTLTPMLCSRFLRVGAQQDAASPG